MVTTPAATLFLPPSSLASSLLSLLLLGTQASSLAGDGDEVARARGSLQVGRDRLQSLEDVCRPPRDEELVYQLRGVGGGSGDAAQLPLGDPRCLEINRVALLAGPETHGQDVSFLPFVVRAVEQEEPARPAGGGRGRERVALGGTPGELLPSGGAPLSLGLDSGIDGTWLVSVVHGVDGGVEAEGRVEGRGAMQRC